MKKNQSALEFMTIVAVGLVLVSLSSYFGYDYIFSYFDSINAINARQTATTLTSAVNLVYSQGLGAQTRAVILIPTKLDQSQTYISGKEINLRVSNRLKDIHEHAAVNMAGAIPINEGEITAYVKMTPGKAVVFYDMPISYVLIDAFSDSSRTNLSDSFNVSNTVYYTIALKDFEEVNIDSDIAVNVYYPNSTLYTTQSVSTSSGFYNGSFVASQTGSWLISTYVPEVGLIGTKLVSAN
jgi:hypothetical protein